MKILIAGSKGGHLEQALRFVDELPNTVRWCLATDAHILVEPAPTVLTRVSSYDKRTNFIIKVLRCLRVFHESLGMCWQERPDLLVTFGAGFCVPLALAARIFGVRVLHIESWSRIRTISATTKYMSRLRLAALIGYQYEDSALVGRRNCVYIGHL